MTNFFAVTGCGYSAVPVLPADAECLPLPSYSQVAGLIMLPLGAAPPANWTDAAALLDTIDNTDTTGAKGRMFLCTGGIEQASDTDVTLGRGNVRTVRRAWTLEALPIWFENEQYAFLRHLQRRNNRAWRIWVITKGGRLLGGPTGIRPNFITGGMAYGAGKDDREQARLTVRWFGDVDADRANVPDILSGLPSFYTPGGGAISDLMIFADIYADHTGQTLTWTKNGGVLPTTNTDAQIGVYMNGQRLLPVQYTFNHGSGPGESQVVIDADTHFDGANYFVVAFITST